VTASTPGPGQRRLISRDPIRADRVRSIAGQGFAFVPNRFLRDGFFASLTPDELQLYFFLVLAGDRQGVSFYAYDKICSLLQMTLETYVEARNGLIDKDLLAFDGTRFQVLSLPTQPLSRVPPPLRTREDFEHRDRATIRSMLQHALAPRDSSDDDSGAT
jgi:hypothetical protein